MPEHDKGGAPFWLQLATERGIAVHKSTRFPDKCGWSRNRGYFNPLRGGDEYDAIAAVVLMRNAKSPVSPSEIDNFATQLRMRAAA